MPASGLSAFESSKKLTIISARWSAAGEALRLRRSTNSKSGSAGRASARAKRLERGRKIELRKDRDREPGVEGREDPGRARALNHEFPWPAGAIELFQGELPPPAEWRIERKRRRLLRIELHRSSRSPNAPLAAERHAIAFADFVRDDDEIELALVEKC